MFTFIVVMIIVVCVLLVLVILAQNAKGGGLSSQFGGSSTSNLIGVKKTGDLLERITWGLAITLLVLSLATNFLIEEPQTDFTSPNIERAQEQEALPNLDLNQQGEQEQQQSVPSNQNDQDRQDLEELLEQQEENND